MDIRDAVDDSSWPEDVSVLGKQGGPKERSQNRRLDKGRVGKGNDARNNPLLVLARLKVRIREEEEELRQLLSRQGNQYSSSHRPAQTTNLALLEEVGEELHRVSPDDRDVLELARVDEPLGSDLVVNVGRDLDTDLHA